MTIELRENDGTEWGYIFSPRYTWIAETPILDGADKVCGLGRTAEEALKNLAEWLAGAAIAIDKDYQVPGLMEDPANA